MEDKIRIIDNVRAMADGLGLKIHYETDHAIVFAKGIKPANAASIFLFYQAIAKDLEASDGIVTDEMMLCGRRVLFNRIIEDLTAGGAVVNKAYKPHGKIMDEVYWITIEGYEIRLVLMPR